MGGSKSKAKPALSVAVVEMQSCTAEPDIAARICALYPGGPLRENVPASDRLSNFQQVCLPCAGKNECIPLPIRAILTLATHWRN